MFYPTSLSGDLSAGKPLTSKRRRAHVPIFQLTAVACAVLTPVELTERKNITNTMRRYQHCPHDTAQPTAGPVTFGYHCFSVCGTRLAFLLCSSTLLVVVLLLARTILDIIAPLCSCS